MTTIEYDDEISHANGAHDTIAAPEPDADQDIGDLGERLAKLLAEFDARIDHLRARGKAAYDEADILEGQRNAVNPGWRATRLPSGVLADEAALREAGHRTEYGMAKPQPKRVRKQAKAKARKSDAKTATPVAKPSVRHGKSLPREGTMGNHVLKAMALDGFDGTARFITEQLGCKPAVVAGQLNNLLARGFVKDNGKERAERRWSRAT